MRPRPWAFPRPQACRRRESHPGLGPRRGPGKRRSRRGAQTVVRARRTRNARAVCARFRGGARGARLPAPRTARPVPTRARSAHTVNPRRTRSGRAVCARCPRGARAVHARCTHRAPAVHPQGTRGARAMRPRHTRGAHAVRPRCSVPAEHPRRARSAPAVPPPRARSAPAVYTQRARRTHGGRCAHGARAARAVHAQMTRRARARCPQRSRSVPAVRPQCTSSAPAEHPQRARSARAAHAQHAPAHGAGAARTRGERLRRVHRAREAREGHAQWAHSARSRAKHTYSSRGDSLSSTGFRFPARLALRFGPRNAVICAATFHRCRRRPVRNPPHHARDSNGRPIASSELADSTGREVWHEIVRISGAECRQRECTCRAGFGRRFALRNLRLIVRDDRAGHDHCHARLDEKPDLRVVPHLLGHNAVEVAAQGGGGHRCPGAGGRPATARQTSCTGTPPSRPT